MNYSGNQLVKAEDSGEAFSLSASMDFKDGAHSPVEYYYDVNENLIKCLNKRISNIAYNPLNLPMTLAIANSFGSATNTYVYAVGGAKLKTVQQWSGGSKQTDYCGNMIYKNGVLKRILTNRDYKL